MKNNLHINSEMIRLYYAIASAVGRETADSMFPHVGRYLASLDTGVRGTGQSPEDD